MVGTAWRLAGVAGFVSGGAAGGAVGWRLGRVAWQLGAVGLLTGLLVIASFLLAMVGLVGPLVAVRYLTDRPGALVGAPGHGIGVLPDQTPRIRLLAGALGYVAVPVFYVALAGVGLYLSRGAGLEPLEGIALLNAVGGGVLGAIGGVTLVTRVRQRRRDDRL